MKERRRHKSRARSSARDHLRAPRQRQLSCSRCPRMARKTEEQQRAQVQMQPLAIVAAGVIAQPSLAQLQQQMLGQTPCLQRCRQCHLLLQGHAPRAEAQGVVQLLVQELRCRGAWLSPGQRKRLIRYPNIGFEAGGETGKRMAPKRLGIGYIRQERCQIV